MNQLADSVDESGVLPFAEASVMVIDNYDSFSWNLVHYLKQLTSNVVVYRNDEIDADTVANSDATHLLISPGPCTPDQSGQSLNIIERCADKLPILGVCLGHQAMAQVFGASIIRAPLIMHGKTSALIHDDSGLFHGLPSPLTVTRYHSLIVDQSTLSSEFKVNAWVDECDQQTVMAIQHQHLPLYGLQFHPESVLSQSGLQLLAGFLAKSC